MIDKALAAAVLAMFAPDAATAQTTPAVCELSESELASQPQGAERVQQIGDMTPFEGAAEGIGGCGVWTIHVKADGTVGETEMLRGEPSGAYERVIPAWLATVRFHPLAEPWTTTTLIALTVTSGEETLAQAQ